MARIYTRKGDKGLTSLFYGGRVKKDHPSIEVNGDLDEAQAVIGLARSELLGFKEVSSWLLKVQHELYIVMSEVACNRASRSKLKASTSIVTEEHIAWLEKKIDELTEKLPPIKDFVIPGNTKQGAILDFARTVVRRAERNLVKCDLEKEGENASKIFAYVNRLSDFLWILARYIDGEIVLAKEV